MLLSSVLLNLNFRKRSPATRLKQGHIQNIEKNSTTVVLHITSVA